MSKIWGIFMSLISSPVWASPLDLNTGFDGTPWISARAAALGQCLSPIANGLDAFYYNPAMIGGLRDKVEGPYFTHLFLPYLGNISSPGGNKILTQELNGDHLDSKPVAALLDSAWGGARPYAGFSASPVFIFNRLMAGYTIRGRTASFLNDEDPLAPKIHVESKSLSGPFLGFSAIAPKNDFYLGVSAAYFKSTETKADMEASTFASDEGRKAALTSGKIAYEGMPINIGMLYRFARTWRPSISIVGNDVGSTRYSPADKTKETAVDKENITVGLGISPPISSWGTLHLMAEATNITQRDLPSRDKFRASSEFTMGNRFGASSGLAVRFAYTSAGLSYGAGLNLGILTAQIASFAEDIGAGSIRVIERRSIVNIGINIVDY